MSMDSRFQMALNVVKEELLASPDVTALLFFGSAQRGEATSGSDIDLYAITSGSEMWVEGRWIEDVEVELHFGPPSGWREQINRSRPVVTHAFASGELLFDKTGEAVALQKAANDRWIVGPPALTPAEIDRLRYRLSDIVRDLEQMPEGSLEARMLSGSLVPAALEAWCAFRRVWPAKPQAMLTRVRDLDHSLADKVEHFYHASSPAVAVDIADAVLGHAGGRIREYSTPRRRV